MEPQTHTVNFYKLQAKKLKKELGIQHVEALDRIARKYGFSNWKHCLKANSSITYSETNSNNLSFTDWLGKQKNRDTPLGDLARDMADDNTWPSYNSFEDYENYLYSKRASWQAIDTLKKAWKSYLLYEKRKLLPKIKKPYSKKSAVEADVRKIVIVKNITPIHFSKRTIEKFELGDKAWISWNGRKAIPVAITEVDERHYSFKVERPIKNAGNEYYLRLDEVRSTPELACQNHVTL